MNKYSIGPEIGNGTFGNVFFGQNNGSGKKVSFTLDNKYASTRGWNRSQENVILFLSTVIFYSTCIDALKEYGVINA